MAAMWSKNDEYCEQEKYKKHTTSSLCYEVTQHQSQTCTNQLKHSRCQENIISIFVLTLACPYDQVISIAIWNSIWKMKVKFENILILFKEWKGDKKLIYSPSTDLFSYGLDGD